MFHRFHRASELFSHRLGSALKMEHTVLDLLASLDEAAQSEHLGQRFREHAYVTGRQIANLERAFAALGEEPADRPCPVMEAIDRESRANIRRTERDLRDAVILAAAGETEHYEIAVYDWLIAEAEAMGRHDVRALLIENLQAEQRTLVEVRSETRRVAARSAA